MPDTPAPATELQAARQRLQRLSWWLDGIVRVPGTRLRFGLDSLIGLMPGVGDVIGMLLGAGILYQGVRIGAPRGVLMRMLRNLAVDAAGGLIPVVGDLFDFAYKAHRRNADLLIEHLDSLDAREAEPERRSHLPALLLMAIFLLGMATLLWWTWRGLLMLAGGG